MTPLSISSSTLPFGNVGTPYTQTLTATGGTGGVTWTLNAGAYLPPGVEDPAAGAEPGRRQRRAPRPEQGRDRQPHARPAQQLGGQAAVPVGDGAGLL